MISFISMPGTTEMVVIGIVGLLIFGNRLPGIAKSIGSSFVEFKKGLQGVDDEINDVKNETRKELSEAEKTAKNLLK